MTNTEIQVGKFGRTNLGKILIFAYIENAQGERYKNKVILTDGKKIINDFYYFEKDEKIVKESSNLIDLIEVGDYVNGHLVVGFNEEVDINGYKYKEIEIESNHLINHRLKLEDIKSIVTKEQMEAMQYGI